MVTLQELCWGLLLLPLLNNVIFLAFRVRLELQIYATYAVRYCQRLSDVELKEFFNGPGNFKSTPVPLDHHKRNGM